MIDWDRVKILRAEIGPEEFGEVVDLFLEEFDEVIARLRTGPGPEALASDMHFLKGGALNFGFSELAALCRVKETRARAGKTIDPAPVVSLYLASRAAFLARVETECAVDAA